LVGQSDIWYVAPWLAVFMLVIAVLTSWLTLRRYLRV
jgi:cell division transport system permease protein